MSSPGFVPRFLTREVVESIHEEQIETFGGLHGVRDESALESAIAAARAGLMIEIAQHKEAVTILRNIFEQC